MSKPDSVPPANPTGLDTDGTSWSGPGASIVAARSSTMPTTASQATGRHLGDASRPSGKTRTMSTRTPRAGTYNQLTSQAAKRPAGSERSATKRA